MSVRRRTVVSAAALGLIVGSTQFPSAASAPAIGYEMPFPCSEQWTGATRANHSPARQAIDWNRPGDLGLPVVAAASGVVTTARTKPQGGYGRWVVIAHGEGESTLYAHLHAVTVRPGQSVDQGQPIGLVGASGNASSAHLHYERRVGSSVVPSWFGGTRFAMGSTPASGNCVDVPMAGNMHGDAAAELVVFRRGLRSTFQVHRPGADPVVIAMGTHTDHPLLGDWDGDGVADPGIRRAKRPVFRLRTPAGVRSVKFGKRFDVPIAGDWNGDGTWEVGIHRPAKGVFRLRLASGGVRVVRLGDADDLPVTGDWDGDGITDLGVYDQRTASFTLLPSGGGAAQRVTFGSPGDLPVVGDWDGDGITDLGAWSPRSATFSLRTAAGGSPRVLTTRFGRPRR